ncbi:MAG: hypothetical protein ACR2QE_14855 [Acidimicrobiales bacterium]
MSDREAPLPGPSPEAIEAFQKQSRAVLGRILRHLLVILASLVGLLLVLSFNRAVFPGDMAQVANLIVIGLGGGYLIWKRPVHLIVAFTVLAAVGGGLMILLAPPAVVLLAARSLRRETDVGRSPRRTARSAAFAGLALLLTLPFLSMALDPSSMAENTSTAAAERQSAQPAPGGGSASGLLQRLADALARVFGQNNGQTVSVGGGEQPPDPDINWWLIAAAVAAGAVLIVGAVLLWRWWRRRGQAGPDATPGWSLLRLEMIGRALGRPRRAHEGALSYADALADRSGDDRLASAGPLVSGHLYESRTTDEELVDRSLTEVEHDPPPRPPLPRLRRFAARVAAPFASASSRRTLAPAALAIVVVLAGGWLLRPHVHDLRAAEAAGEPPGWAELRSAPADDLVRWQMCAVTEFGAVTARTGLGHRSRPLAAMSENDYYEGDISYGSEYLHDGDTGATRYGDEGWVDNVGIQVPIRPFTSVDEVLATMVAEPTPGETVIDRFGDSFTRWESLPVDWADIDFSERGSEIIPTVHDLVWVVDIWTDASTIPTRIRVMTNEPAARWYEWRRTVVSGGQARFHPPSCPPDLESPTDEWIGWEPWTQTLTVPLQVSFDSAGNPYDNGYYGAEFSPAVWASAGALPSAASFTVMSPYDLLPELAASSENPYRVTTDWPGEMTAEHSVGEDGWEYAFRISRAGGAAVARWDQEATIDIAESAVAITLAPVVFDSEEELWALLDRTYRDEGEPVAADLDGEPGDDLFLLGQYFYGADVVRGLDESGALTSVVIWDQTVPWRVLGLEGTVPAEVKHREDQLRACIAGTRPIDADGTCARDD